MIIDMRTYDIVPRQMPNFMKAFNELGLPVMKKYFGEPVGLYVTEVGHINQLTQMWGFKDYADMETKRKARDADPDWPAYFKATEGLLFSQENKIIRPVA